MNWRVSPSASVEEIASFTPGWPCGVVPPLVSNDASPAFLRDVHERGTFVETPP